jgi:lipopolysaccharide biosynthesis glycosyltransferase
MNNNKLIFVSLFNYGGIELAKNHLSSLILHGITNYCGFCTDRESEAELKALNYNVEYVNFDRIHSGKLNFDTPEFNKLSYFRYVIILDLLKQGYDVWYLDIDTVVLDNLNKKYDYCRKMNESNIWFQDDMYMLCTGCILLLHSKETIDIITKQIDTINDGHIDKLKNNDQTIMDYILKTYYSNYMIGIFSIYEFPNGFLFFKDEAVISSNPEYLKQRKYFQENYSIHPEQTLFIHANWIVGIDQKIDALKSHGLWYV